MQKFYSYADIDDEMRQANITQFQEVMAPVLFKECDVDKAKAAMDEPNEPAITIAEGDDINAVVEPDLYHVAHFSNINWSLL